MYRGRLLEFAVQTDPDMLDSVILKFTTDCDDFSVSVSREQFMEMSVALLEAVATMHDLH